MPRKLASQFWPDHSRIPTTCMHCILICTQCIRKGSESFVLHATNFPGAPNADEHFAASCFQECSLLVSSNKPFLPPLNVQRVITTLTTTINSVTCLMLVIQQATQNPTACLSRSFQPSLIDAQAMCYYEQFDTLVRFNQLQLQLQNSTHSYIAKATASHVQLWVSVSPLGLKTVM